MYNLLVHEDTIPAFGGGGAGPAPASAAVDDGGGEEAVGEGTSYGGPMEASSTTAPVMTALSNAEPILAWTSL